MDDNNQNSIVDDIINFFEKFGASNELEVVIGK